MFFTIIPIGTANDPAGDCRSEGVLGGSTGGSNPFADPGNKEGNRFARKNKADISIIF